MTKSVAVVGVGSVVCCSGAIGCVGSRRLWETHLTYAAVNHVIAAAGRYGAGVAGFDGAQWHATSAYRKLNPAMDDGPEDADVTGSMLSRRRCLAMAVIHSRDEVLTEISRALVGNVRTGLSQVGGRSVVDITSPLVDKGTGVLLALGMLGADPAAAISFGDMPNDIPMFAVTGRAYAVGSGHPSVTAAVCETLDPVEQDGFATKIRELSALDWRLH